MRKCWRCGVVEIRKGAQKFCGSYKRKTGCSYIEHRLRMNKYLKEYRKRHTDDWKRTEIWRKAHNYYTKEYYRKKYLKHKAKIIS